MTGLSLLFFSLGAVVVSSKLTAIEQGSTLERWIASIDPHQNSELSGIVREPCEQSGTGFRIVVEVSTLKQGMRREDARGRVLLKIQNGACIWRPGDLIRASVKLKSPGRFQNFFSFDYPFFLKTRGITVTGWVEKSDSVAVIGHQKDSILDQLILFRERVVAVIDRVSNAEHAGLLRALLLGDSTGLNDPLKDAFRRTGTLHLLVVSGLHLALVSGIFYGFFRFVFGFFPSFLLRFSSSRISVFLSIPLILFYAAFVGFSISVLRALLGCFLLSFFLLCRSEKDHLSILFIVAFLILLFDPLALFGLSFPLSFLSVFFILIYTPFLERSVMDFFPFIPKNRFFSAIITGSSASFAVQLGLTPFLIHQFHQMSLVGFVANLFFVPAFGFILMPLGIFALVFVPFWPGFSERIFEFLSLCLEPLLWFLYFLSDFDWSAPFVAGFDVLQLFFVYALLFGLLISSVHPILKYRKPFLLLLCLGCFLSWTVPWLLDRRSDALRLTLFDVGQGDALLVELPKGFKILVDGGGIPYGSFDIGKEVLVPTLLGRGISHLDAVILTHPHPDHYGGLEAVVEVFNPDEFWWNGQQMEDPRFKRLQDLLEKKKILTKRIDSESPAFEWSEVQFTFLNPPKDFVKWNAKTGKAINNASLVLRLDYRERSFLLAGDIEKETEKKLLENGGSLRANFLKVPHHGSDSSSTAEWLHRVNPDFAFIGVGRENRFRFPRPTVLERYQKLGTRVFRTDQDGEISVSWDGKDWDVSTFADNIF